MAQQSRKTYNINCTLCPGEKPSIFTKYGKYFEDANKEEEKVYAFVLANYSKSRVGEENVDEDNIVMVVQL